jgi:hypothetical protein
MLEAGVALAPGSGVGAAEEFWRGHPSRSSTGEAQAAERPVAVATSSKA